MPLLSSSRRITPMNVATTNADQYGQRHVIENPMLISDSLLLFEKELVKLSPEDSEGIHEAEIKCPMIFRSEDHRLMFLRCELFNAKLAAKRFAKYWNKRIELFGDKAFMPMTLEGALQDDIVALLIGFVRLLPEKDESGRALIWLDASYLDSTKYTRESMIRAITYIEHVALEDETVQKKGVIFINYNGNNPKFGQFDRHLISMWADSMKGCMPVRVSAMYILQIPTLFTVLANLFKCLLGSRLAKRLRILPGPNEKILTSLSKRGIGKELLPMEVGGGTVLDQGKWAEERMRARK